MDRKKKENTQNLKLVKVLSEWNNVPQISETNKFPGKDLREIFLLPECTQ